MLFFGGSLFVSRIPDACCKAKSAHTLFALVVWIASSCGMRCEHRLDYSDANSDAYAECVAVHIAFSGSMNRWISNNFFYRLLSAARRISTHFCFGSIWACVLCGFVQINKQTNRCCRRIVLCSSRVQYTHQKCLPFALQLAGGRIEWCIQRRLTGASCRCRVY